MTHGKDMRRIASEGLAVFGGPAQGQRHVINEGRVAVFRVQAIIHHHGHEALGGEGATDEAVSPLVALLP